MTDSKGDISSFQTSVLVHSIQMPRLVLIAQMATTRAEHACVHCAGARVLAQCVGGCPLYMHIVYIRGCCACGRELEGTVRRIAQHIVRMVQKGSHCLWKRTLSGIVSHSLRMVRTERESLSVEESSSCCEALRWLTHTVQHVQRCSHHVLQYCALCGCVQLRALTPHTPLGYATAHVLHTCCLLLA